jgi:hypothetical protein
MGHRARRTIWFCFGRILSKLGYGAETNDNESVFYIGRVRK